jgi:FkbM family methyltransferase
LRRFEIIEDHSLHTGLLQSESRVLDLGANAGRFTQTIVERFGCNVVAVEPNPKMFDLIPPHPRVRKFPYAITANTGPIEFHISDLSLGSSLGEVTGAHQGTITVLGKNLEELIGEIGWSRIDLLKMDIEGAEIDVFASCSDRLLQTIAQITVEFHDFIGVVSSQNIRKVLSRLESRGFRWVSRVGGWL